ncbi:Kazal-type serine protease inhibitor family protein [Bradyrhizobium sp.]|jgi:hypothetical protein|uniref:Kazal-type serine protease inhibitor family protein n=1 Tax=Bradyrhizobium sp. TaxID=376 RepID=UPI002E02A9AB|nr:Kazal-type serine protease inhibitor family protein [Bradyrhizobium sp.]
MRTRLRHLTVAAFALALGATLASVGATAANLDEACGGKDAITCNSALWCRKQAGQCSVADAAGKCEKAPSFCMRVSRPVCGCNGKTYPNDCERQRVKVQLDHDGACKKETPPPAAPGKKRTKAS